MNLYPELKDNPCSTCKGCDLRNICINNKTTKKEKIITLFSLIAKAFIVAMVLSTIILIIANVT